MRFDRITFNPNIMGGKPCIRGMRVTVGTIIGLMAEGKSQDEILKAYPYLEKEDLTAALSYADWRLNEIEVLLRNEPMNKLFIRVEWADRDKCCVCRTVCFVHSGSDGHRYCESCRADLVKTGKAELGGHATTKRHNCNLHETVSHRTLTNHCLYKE